MVKMHHWALFVSETDIFSQRASETPRFLCALYLISQSYIWLHQSTFRMPFSGIFLLHCAHNNLLQRCLLPQDVLCVYAVMNRLSLFNQSISCKANFWNTEIYSSRHHTTCFSIVNWKLTVHNHHTTPCWTWCDIYHIIYRAKSKR